MSDDVAGLRAVVRGRVQGVGFRDFVETRARMLKLTGTVRNLDSDRSVEVIAEGPRESLEELLRHLHDGPRMGRVDAVDVEWCDATGGFTKFGTLF